MKYFFAVVLIPLFSFGANQKVICDVTEAYDRPPAKDHAQFSIDFDFDPATNTGKDFDCQIFSDCRYQAIVDLNLQILSVGLVITNSSGRERLESFANFKDGDKVAKLAVTRNFTTPPQLDMRYQSIACYIK